MPCELFGLIRMGNVNLWLLEKLWEMRTSVVCANNNESNSTK